MIEKYLTPYPYTREKRKYKFDFIKGCEFFLQSKDFLSEDIIYYQYCLAKEQFPAEENIPCQQKGFSYQSK